MSFSLRPYQEDIISQARSLMMNGVKSILITAPTGSGKTCLAAHMLNSAAQKGMDSLFLVHRRELIKQSTATFSEVGVRHGIIANGFTKDPGPKIQLASVQTVTNRLDKIRKPKFLMWDECHHLSAGSWARIFHAFPDAFHIGLTATPERLDGQGLGKFFKEMIRGPEVEWLIENGFLSKYKIYAPPSPNMKGVHTRMGEYVNSEVSAIFSKPTIVGDSVKQYKKHAMGKRAVMFAPSVSASETYVAAFNAAGIRAAHVDGETPSDERDFKINQFKNGQLDLLSNVNLFGEGFDVPAIEVVIDVSPTLSLGAYLQRFGRALRIFPGKTVALYLDQAGNVEKHGLPDEIREWSLEGNITRKKNLSNVSIRVCKKCFAAMKITCQECSYCGYLFPVQSRIIEEVAGDLIEVDPEQIRKSRAKEQGTAGDEASLIALGIKRGYKRPELWARYIMMARKRKK